MSTAAFPQTPLNQVNRRRQRGAYDHPTIHALIDKCPVLNVAFNAPTSDPYPVVLPMIGCTGLYDPTTTTTTSDDPAPETRSIYLHGHISTRLFKLPSSSTTTTTTTSSANPSEDNKNETIPVTISATLLDGLILALTPFNHSVNYRSILIFGTATPVTDPPERLYALERITNNLIPSRWSHTRPPTPTELNSTGVLKVEILSGSAKVHRGGPSDERRDLRDEGVRGGVWTGVVPTWLEMGAVREGVENGVREVPAYVREWWHGTREERRAEAEASLVDEKGRLGVK